MDNKKLFLAMSRRRVACPQVTQQLWDSIKNIRGQRQVPIISRINRYMLRAHNVKEDEVSRQLLHCVRDGLIKLIKKRVSKGAKTGDEQDSYCLPSGPVDKDDYDWYCFECHSGGDVICCTACYRVYHLACIPNEELPNEDVKNTFVCHFCKICKAKENPEEKPKMTKKMLNRLLDYICARLTGRLPALLMSRKVLSSAGYATDRAPAQPGSALSTQHWVTDEDDAWRSEYLIYRPIQLAELESKAKAGEYLSFQRFQADLQTLIHNVVIYHGVDSVLSDIARQMLRDCIYDIGEIERCHDCYRFSNEKKNKHWFCQPCRPPHELVYAKQKTFPYWPAKVIKVEGDMYDVRFFGSEHERAVINKTNIRPISVNIHTLQVKRSSAWNKACEELKYHQKLLDTASTKNLNSSPYDFQSSSDEETAPESVKSVLKKPVRKYQSTKKAKVVLPKEGEEEEEEEPEQEEETNPELESVSMEDSSSSSSRNVHSPNNGKAGLSQEDMVSSSCQEPRSRSIAVQASRSKQGPLKATFGKQQRDFEREKEAAVAEACRDLEEQLTEQHAEEMKRVKAEHVAEISDIKLKQWCYNCEKEAIYHCCWNTAYCSIKCQQDHWMTEHKPHCRRKR